jgi:hypothetical protein
VKELFIDPLPEGASREGALYPDGAHLTDLKEVRGLLYKMQRPAIAPSVSLSAYSNLFIHPELLELVGLSA